MHRLLYLLIGLLIGGSVYAADSTLVKLNSSSTIKDAFLLSGVGTATFGGTGAYPLGVSLTYSKTYRVVVYPVLSSIPTGAYINSGLYVWETAETPSHLSDRYITVSEINSDWIVGTADWSAQDGSVSWIERGFTISNPNSYCSVSGVCNPSGWDTSHETWVTAGGDFSNPADTINARGKVAGDTLAIDNTGTLRSQRAGSSFGFMLHATSATAVDSIVGYDAIEAASSDRPRQYVWYTALPDSVMSFAINVATCGVAKLTWNDSTDTDSVFVLKAGVRIAALKDSINAYNDTTTTGSHDYRVVAWNIAGTCSTATKTATVTGCAPPEAPVVTSVTSADCEDVLVEWTEDAICDTIWIYLDAVLIDSVLDDVGEYTDTPGGLGTFCYTLIASGPTGSSEESDCGEITLETTEQVVGVVASGSYCDSVVVTWTDLAGEDSFQVRRGGTRIGVTAADVVSFTDTTGTDYTSYSYTVAAYNRCGAGTVSAGDAGEHAGAPLQVTGVAASDGGCDEIDVSWNNAAHETGYKIYRDAVEAGTTDADIVTFTDTGGEAGVSYSYTVLAYNSCGDGAASSANTGSQVTQMAAVSGVAATDNNCDSVTVTWSNIAGEDSFQVRRGGTRIGVTAANVLVYKDLTAVAGVTYSYAVVAYNVCGAGIATGTNGGYRVPLPGQVTGLHATSTVNWIYADWAEEALADSYCVYVDGVAEDTVETETFSYEPGDLELHTITVSAYGQCGEGVQSKAVRKRAGASYASGGGNAAFGRGAWGR